MFSLWTVADDRLLWVVLAALLVLVALVGKKAAPSDVKMKPGTGFDRPMLALEMNAGKARDMFESWDDEATRAKFRKAILWDYIFIFIYPAAIAASCFITAKFFEAREFLSFKFGLTIICLQLVAAMLDAVENYALLRVLDNSAGASWPQVARWCAIFKFGIVALGVGYVIVGIVYWLYGLIRALASH